MTIKEDMRREDLLIGQLIKVNSGRGAGHKIQEILSQRVDWNYFLNRAGNEGVIPLVYKNLSEINCVKSMVPEEIWGRLEGSYYAVALRNTRLCEKMGDILNSFNRAGIDIVILKGMALIQSIYPNIALRPMYDIDILIHKEDFSSVETKLRELGYANSAHYPEDFHKEDMMVDVHWDLMNVTRIKSRNKAYSIDLDDLWRSSVFLEINGQRARILSPEHCLMGLCLHLSLHHGLQGLMRFIDIAGFMGHYKNEIDWDKFIKKSFEYKIYKPIYYALFYIKEVLGQDMPQFVLDKLKPKKQGLLERKILNLIVSGYPIENVRFFFTLANMQNLFDKLIFLREVALPSPRVISAKYNLASIRLVPRYYLIHFGVLLSSVFKLLRKFSLAYPSEDWLR